jgi:hypothetical protein
MRGRGGPASSRRAISAASSARKLLQVLAVPEHARDGGGLVT